MCPGMVSSALHTAVVPASCQACHLLNHVFLLSSLERPRPGRVLKLEAGSSAKVTQEGGNRPEASSLSPRACTGQNPESGQAPVGEEVLVVGSMPALSSVFLVQMLLDVKTRNLSNGL